MIYTYQLTHKATRKQKLLRYNGGEKMTKAILKKFRSSVAEKWHVPEKEIKIRATIT